MRGHDIASAPLPATGCFRADCARYRRRLRDVTRVALDLHEDPAHRGALVAMSCPPNDAALHTYSARYSPTYRELCNTRRRARRSGKTSGRRALPPG